MERYWSQHHYCWFECEKLKAFSTQKRQQNENKHKFQFNGILLEPVSQQAAQGFFLFPLAASYPWKMHHNFSNLFSTIYVLLRQMESNDLPFESWSCNTWDQLFLLPKEKKKMLLLVLYIMPHTSSKKCEGGKKQGI